MNETEPRPTSGIGALIEHEQKPIVTKRGDKFTKCAQCWDVAKFKAALYFQPPFSRKKWPVQDCMKIAVPGWRFCQKHRQSMTGRRLMTDQNWENFKAICLKDKMPIPDRNKVQILWSPWVYLQPAPKKEMNHMADAESYLLNQGALVARELTVESLWRRCLRFLLFWRKK